MNRTRLTHKPAGVSCHPKPWHDRAFAQRSQTPPPRTTAAGAAEALLGSAEVPGGCPGPTFACTLACCRSYSYMQLLCKCEPARKKWSNAQAAGAKHPLDELSTLRQACLFFATGASCHASLREIPRLDLPRGWMVGGLLEAGGRVPGFGFRLYGLRNVAD